MAESARQELEFNFAGKDWAVRPEFKTIISIEAALNQPSRTLGLKCLNYEISVGELAALIWVLLKDDPKAPDKDAIGPALVEEGYDKLMLPLGQYLTRAVKGNKEHEKEAAAAAAKQNP